MNMLFNDRLIEQKDVAMMIDAPPRFVQACVRLVPSGQSKPQVHHLRALVLGILVNCWMRGNPQVRCSEATGTLRPRMRSSARGLYRPRSPLRSCFVAISLRCFPVILSRVTIQQHVVRGLRPRALSVAAKRRLLSSFKRGHASRATREGSGGPLCGALRRRFVPGLSIPLSQ